MRFTQTQPETTTPPLVINRLTATPPETTIRDTGQARFTVTRLDMRTRLLVTKLFTVNSTGFYSTAQGAYALFSTTIGNSNTANGIFSLYFNTIGSFNTGVGRGALYFSTTPSNNAAFGYQTLRNNTTGANNTGCGTQALLNNTTGSNNIGVGNGAGTNVTSGSNNIEIGSAGVSTDSGVIRIGTSGTQTSTYVAGIRGVAIGSAVAVGINSSGQLGTPTSSARFKENIQPMKEASESILKVEPVTFRYKHELSPESIREFGLIAEQVEKVNPDLIVRDAEGKPFSVRYEAVNAMLLNEFLKAHRKLDEQVQINQQQNDTITQLQAADAEQRQEIKTLAETLKEQAAQLRKVSEQVASGGPATRMAANNP